MSKAIRVRADRSSHRNGIVHWVSLLLFLAAGNLHAQHTFSIVAIDPDTREIGSAGATCGDSVLWPGTPGARIISEIIPNVAGIHTQASYLSANQVSAHNRIVAGDSPSEAIAWLVENDAEHNPAIRQYGIVAYVDEEIEAAAHTGDGCFDEKSHVVGANYSIQGNILLSNSILDSMEAAFLRQPGRLAFKLMAALQAAKIVGADSRCSPRNVSSLSAFLRVAQPDDASDDLSLDITIAATPDGIDPIDRVQARLDELLSVPVASNPDSKDKFVVVQSEDYVDILPVDESLRTTGGAPLTRVSVVNSSGGTIAAPEPTGNNGYRFRLDGLATGYYWIVIHIPSSGRLETHPLLMSR